MATDGWRVLPVSARDAAALARVKAQLLDYLRSGPKSAIADIAYTLQSGREHHAARRAVICRAIEGASAALDADDPRHLTTGITGETAAPIAFLFPGGGAQHVNMGRGLYASEPIYRAQVDRCAELLAPMLARDLRQVMFPADGDLNAATALLARTALGLPALFVTEYAQAQLLMARWASGRTRCSATASASTRRPASPVCSRSRTR